MDIDRSAGHKPVRYTAPPLDQADAPALTFQSELEDAASAFQHRLKSSASAFQRELARTGAYAAALSDAQKDVVRVLKNNGTAAELDSAQATSTVAEHRLKGMLLHLAVPEQPLSLPRLMHGPVVGGVAAGIPGSVAAGISDSESDADFWRRISDAIGGIKNDYLGVFETAMGKNNDFQKDFTYILSQLSQWQKGDDKNTTLKIEGSKKVAKSPEEMAKLIAETKAQREADNEELLRNDPKVALLLTDDVSIRADLVSQGLDKKDAPDGLLDALKDLLEKYKDGASTVFIADQEDFYWTDEDEKAGRGKSGERITDPDVISQHNQAITEKWATDLGLPKDAVLKSANDNITWLVKLDFSPVKTMIEGLEDMKIKTPPDADGNVTLSTSSFQAWKVGFDAQAERIKSNSTVMANKLVNAQSIYENLIKVLSSTIAAMMETNKLFLQN